MNILGGIGDDHPDGPDVIRDLVWGTALQALWEKPELGYLHTETDPKLDAVIARHDLE